MCYFYSKIDKNKEPIGRFNEANSRLEAAKYFAVLKNMTLKKFLSLFSVENS